MIFDPTRYFIEPNLAAPNRKPIRMVRIRRDRPITLGLEYAFVDRYLNNQALANWSTPLATRFQNTSRGGQSGLTATTATNLRFAREKSYRSQAADPFTFIVHTYPQDGGTGEDPAILGTVNRCYLGFNWTNDQYTLHARYAGDGSALEYLSTDTIDFDSENIIIVTHDTGTRQAIFRNGVLEDEAFGTLNLVNYASDQTTTYPYYHHLRSAFFFNRALSDSEAQSLSKDLYQLVEPAANDAPFLFSAGAPPEPTGPPVGTLMTTGIGR